MKRMSQIWLEVKYESIFLESLFILETFKHVLFKCCDLNKLFLLKINLFFHFQILVLFALMVHGMV
jgi:hypothetical protein